MRDAVVMNHVQVLGLPIVSGIQTVGATDFSKTFIEMFLENLDQRSLAKDKAEIKVPHLGQDPGPDKKLRYLGDYVRMVETSRRGFDSLYNPTEFPLIVGGDCGIILASLPRLVKAHKDMNVIWFDAHGDFNTPKTTPSGFIGGMVLALATGRGPPKLTRQPSKPIIQDEKVALLATRDLDRGEKINIKDSGLFHRNYKKGELSSDVIAFLERTQGPVMMHLDVDALDPSVIPSVNFPVYGGPSLGEVSRSLFRVKDSGRLCAVEVASLDVRKDRGGKSTGKIAELLLRLLF